jgi:hypothetical protein
MTLLGISELDESPVPNCSIEKGIAPQTVSL